MKFEQRDSVERGIPVVALLAYALDPRFKQMAGLNNKEQELIRKEVARRVEAIAIEEGIHADHRHHHSDHVRTQGISTVDTIGDLFDELTGNETQGLPNTVLGTDEVSDVVNGELLLYLSAAAIPRKSFH